MHSVMTESKGWYQIPLFFSNQPRHKGIYHSLMKDVEKCTWNIMLFLLFFKCNVTGMLSNKNSHFQYFFPTEFMFSDFIPSNVTLHCGWAVGYYGKLCKLNDVIKMKMIILNKDKYTNTANIKKMRAINENLNYVFCYENYII